MKDKIGSFPGPGPARVATTAHRDLRPRREGRSNIGEQVALLWHYKCQCTSKNWHSPSGGWTASECASCPCAWPKKRLANVGLGDTHRTASSAISTQADTAATAVTWCSSWYCVAKCWHPHSRPFARPPGPPSPRLVAASLPMNNTPMVERW